MIKDIDNNLLDYIKDKIFPQYDSNIDGMEFNISSKLSREVLR